MYAQLLPTGAKVAQQAGFTGKGVKIGILGFGADPTTPPLEGRITWFKSYLAGGSQTPNDTSGHGSVVADVLGGLAQGTDRVQHKTFPGGVAPDADLYVEQVCTANDSCQWNADNFKDFAARHVRAINISLGDPGSSTLLSRFSSSHDSRIARLRDIYQPAVDADIVLVWSAMNVGDAQPSLQAGLPYWIPEFQPNWLAVVNVAVDGDGKPDGLWTGMGAPSNACGAAAEWCLAAPGLAYAPEPNVPGTSYQGGGVGTSFAAPVVTGTVALVLQAYPWMSAANVTDTILTTATPIDDGSHQTPNATFGWGMVNAGKAVHGPAQFAFPQFGPFTADVPDGVSATFFNAIGGPGGLKLTGPGTLVLTGANTFAGGSEIAAGTLTVNGSVASDVSVDSAGTLDGVGTVKADVTNAGTVASRGTAAAQGLTITGNLTDTADSTTAVALGNPLTVGGTAKLAGTMQVLASPPEYTVKSTERLLNAGSLSGTFGKLSFASGVFYTGKLDYTSTQVNVTLTQNNVIHTTAVSMVRVASVQTLQSAANVQAALNKSNQWVGTEQAQRHSAWMHAAGRFLAAANVHEAAASLNSLSGEIYATSRAVEVQQSLVADAALANREHALALQRSPGIWAQALGADGSLARDGYDAADYRAGGTMIGFDGPLTQAWAAGVAAGRVRVWSTLGGLGGRVNARENMGAAYVRWDNDGGLYVTARGSYAKVDNEVSRHVLLAGTPVALTGARTDHLTMLTVEAGDAMSLASDATLSPYVALTGLRLHQEGFVERGSAMGLAAPVQTHTATLGTLGVRYGRKFSWALGRSSIEGYVAWRHVLGGADLGMRASFAGLPEAPFTAHGQDLPRNVGLLGVHWNTRVNRHWGWFIDAALQTGSAGLHQSAATAGIRISM